MMGVTRDHRVLIMVGLIGAMLAGCVSFSPVTLSKVESNERPSMAILLFGFDVEITKLSYVRTVEDDLSPEDESKLLAEALQEIQQEARGLFQSRLTAGQGFRIVPLEQTDALAAELQLKPGDLPNAEQLAEFHRRLGADLVVAGSILDFGKVRWQWMLAGMLADMTWESVALGLATNWHPGAIFGNIGFELLTSTPVWFGGGYLFGIAFRPVRVEARAFNTVKGEQVWKEAEASAYARDALKEFPEEIRKKKETQLKINLAGVMESLADSLLKEELTVSQLREKPEAAQ
jgi:hypothetical protein